MPLTRDYRETILARARRDLKFRELMLASGVQCLLTGEVVVAKLTIRDYIESSIGYEKLGSLTGASPKSLACMFGKKGNPSVADLYEIIVHIQQHEGIQFEVKVVPAEVEEEEEEAEAQVEVAATAAR